MPSGQQSEPEHRTDPGAQQHQGWRRWVTPETVPHWLTAIFTLFLAIFAFYAWLDSKRGADALEGQLKAILADQRPYLWVTYLDQPTYYEPTGQILWNWKYTNIGKGSASNVRALDYIRIGNEKFQMTRNIGPDAVEASFSVPTKLPPSLTDYHTLASRPGISKEYFAKLMTTDLALGLLVEFTYTDSANAEYSESICHSRFASGAFPKFPPEACAKQ